MAETVAPFLLGTAITSIFLVAGYVVASWREASRSTRKTKSTAEAPATPTSDARYVQVLAEMAELSSTVEKLALAVKRNSSRAYQRDLRDRQAEQSTHGAPPVGASKAELRKFYIAGKSGPDIARKQLESEDGTQSGGQ